MALSGLLVGGGGWGGGGGVAGIEEVRFFENGPQFDLYLSDLHK